jgi:hypothetical protein
MTAKVGKICVGIGGWTYPPWRGMFYPKGLPHSRELAHTAERHTSIEANGRLTRSFLLLCAVCLAGRNTSRLAHRAHASLRHGAPFDAEAIARLLSFLREGRNRCGYKKERGGHQQKSELHVAPPSHLLKHKFSIIWSKRKPAERIRRTWRGWHGASGGEGEEWIRGARVSESFRLRLARWLDVKIKSDR